MKTAAYITASYEDVKKLLPAETDGMEIDVFVLPQEDARDFTERDGNISIHRYSTTAYIEENNELRFQEIMRDFVAICPSICYINLQNEFGIQTYKLCKHYGIQVEFINK